MINNKPIKGAKANSKPITDTVAPLKAKDKPDITNAIPIIDPITNNPTPTKAASTSPVNTIAVTNLGWAATNLPQK